LSSLTKGLILLLVILGIGVGLVFWKSKANGQSYNSISKAEIELLLTDIAKTNPMALKRLAEDEEMKKQQLESLKQLLAFATEAQKEGLTNEPNNQHELQNIEDEVVAVNYDREMNKDKGPMPPFGFITEDQVKQFWGEGDQSQAGWWDSLKAKIGLGTKDKEIEFDKFLDTKLAMLAESNPKMKDRKLTDDERNQARDFFAKIAIYNKEYKTSLPRARSRRNCRTRSSFRPNCSRHSFWQSSTPRKWPTS
jgi:hypothetical protein